MPGRTLVGGSPLAEELLIHLSTISASCVAVTSGHSDQMTSGHSD